MGEYSRCRGCGERAVKAGGYCHECREGGARPAGPRLPFDCACTRCGGTAVGLTSLCHRCWQELRPSAGASARASHWCACGAHEQCGSIVCDCQCHRCRFEGQRSGAGWCARRVQYGNTLCARHRAYARAGR